MKTFHLTNFGCRASQADGAAIKGQLLTAGLEPSADLTGAEVAVLNTCTVTAAADAEVRQVIRRIHRANPDCRILVTGCYAQRSPIEISKLDGVAWVVGNSHKHQVANLLGGTVRNGESGAPASYLPRQAGTAANSQAPDDRVAGETALTLVGDVSNEFHFAPSFADERTRPTLKVQDGCDARCAFCIIPSVRGRSRSLPPAQVIAEVRELESLGFREVVISGINLGGYGRDLGRSINFPELLERILSETAAARLRISSIEPMDVSPALIRLAARESRVADHFHVPLQSGSDRILRLMSRRYWVRQYAERILAVREMLPQAGIGADVMTGFPGETAEDHAATMALVERLPFTYLHVFPYSARPGTAAAGRSEQMAGRVAHIRARELRTMATQKRQAFLDAHLGRRLSVLTLDQELDSLQTLRKSRRALSSNYLSVSLEIPDMPANALLEVEIGRVSAGMLHGYGVRAC
jgi:threonylcarbamoyladenosine tRNA methylthiotransferase MtaB